MECAFVRRTTEWMLEAIVALVFAQILGGPMITAYADQCQTGSRRNRNRRPRFGCGRRR